MNIQNFKFTHFENLINKEYSKKYIQNEIAKIFPDQKGFSSLFTVEDGNPKTSKGQKLKVHTKILHMSPSTTSKDYFLNILKKWESIKENQILNSKENYLNNPNFESEFNEIDLIIKKLKAYEKFGFNFCAMASLGCIKACLFNSGNPIYDRNNNKTNARHKRSIVFIVLRDLFLRLLKLEIDSAFKSFNTNPKFKDYDYLGFRLNGTQDSLWESIRFDNGESVIEYIIRNGGIPYDYTKYINRHTKKNFPKGYHLTFSYSGDNLENCIKAYESGLNIAIPFIGKYLPKYFKLGKYIIPVFNGDESDCRFLDPKNHIIGLKFKFDTKNGIDRDSQIQNAVESGFAIDSVYDSNCLFSLPQPLKEIGV